jgi:hypothetical protein
MHDSSVRIVEGRDVPSHPSSSEAPPAPIRPPSPVLLRHCYCPLRIHTSYMTPMRRGARARARVPAPPVSTNRSEGMSLQRGLQPPVRSNTPIKFAHYKYNVPVCPSSPSCLFTVVAKSPDPLVGWGGVGPRNRRRALLVSLCSHVSLSPRRLALQARRSDPVARCFQAHDLGADGQGGHLTLARLSLEPEALVVDLREDRRRLPAKERSSRPPEGT